MNDTEHMGSHINIAGDLGELKAGQKSIRESLKRLQKDLDEHLHNHHGHPRNNNRFGRDTAIKGGGLAALIAGLVAAAEALSRVFGF